MEISEREEPKRERNRLSRKKVARLAAPESARALRRGGGQTVKPGIEIILKDLEFAKY